MMLRSFIFAAFFSLTACSAGPQAYTAKPSTVPFEQAAPGYQGMLPVNITTQVRMPEVWDNMAGRGLVEGAQCVARSTAFALSFTTPSKIEVPDYGRQSPPIEVTCRLGDLTGDTQIVPQDMSDRVRYLDGLIKPQPRWFRVLLEDHHAGGPRVWTYQTVAVVFLDPT